MKWYKPMLKNIMREESMSKYLNLADVFESVSCFVLGAVIIMTVNSGVLNSTPEELFLFASLGMGLMAFGFIRFIYKFFRTHSKTGEQKV